MSYNAGTTVHTTPRRELARAVTDLGPLSTGHAPPTDRACESCHRRKVRCDARQRGLPCSNCISSRKTDCRMHEKKRRNVTAYVARQRPEVAIECANVPGAISSANGFLPDNEVASNMDLEALSHEHTSTSPSTDQSMTRSLIALVDESDNAHRPIQNGVRITFVGEDVSNLNFLLSQRQNYHGETVLHFPSDQLAKRLLSHENQMALRAAAVLPDRATADKLVEAYFARINSRYPIVDEDQSMRQYTGRNAADPPSLLLLQAILLVGAHASLPSPTREQVKAETFQRAKCLFDSRQERNRDVMVQAALLLTWHSDGEDDIGSNAWYWIGVAARIAFGLGMHRDAGASSLIPQDKRIWRRTWWILVQFDVMVSLFYGRIQAMYVYHFCAESIPDIASPSTVIWKNATYSRFRCMTSRAA